MSKAYPILPGPYRALFLYIEPLLTILSSFMIWFFPGATWFYNEQAPSPSLKPLDANATLVTWQLANCYALLGLLEGLVLRAVRDAIQENPVAQETITGAVLKAMALADVTHVLVTLLATPREIVLAPDRWNGAFMGNVTFVVVLLIGRLLWLAGVGRKSYNRGVKPHVKRT